MAKGEPAADMQTLLQRNAASAAWCKHDQRVCASRHCAPAVRCAAWREAQPAHAALAVALGAAALLTVAPAAEAAKALAPKADPYAVTPPFVHGVFSSKRCAETASGLRGPTLHRPQRGMYAGEGMNWVLASICRASPFCQCQHAPATKHRCMM